MFWADLQQAFALTLGPFISQIFLPGLAAAGLMIAIIQAVIKIVRER